MAVLLTGCMAQSGDKQSEDSDTAKDSDTGLGVSTGSLRVLTYNVHGLPSLLTGDDTPGRMVQIAPLLQGWDLVGLQEDWDADNHAMLIGETDHMTKLWFDETVSADRYYGSGLSLLARYPVIEGVNTHYTACNGVVGGASDCLASKGFQVVRLQVGTAQIDVYNTHFEAGGGAEDNAARAVQVGQIVDALGGYSAGRAVIFTGDFNLRASDPDDLPELMRLKDEGGLTDVCSALNCPEPDHIDRVFIRSSDRVQLRADGWANVSSDFLDSDSVGLSDHPPISATVAWETLD